MDLETLAAMMDAIKWLSLYIMIFCVIILQIKILKNIGKGK